MNRKSQLLLMALFLTCSQKISLATPSIKYATPEAVKSAMSASKGHVLVVNFWATWCPPCVAEYPSLVKLDRKFKAQGIEVIAVSLDVPDDIAGKVTPFVQKSGADFMQFVLKVDDPEKAIDAFDPSWQGDIPRTFVYARSGRLIKTLAGEQTYAAFESNVESALKST